MPISERILVVQKTDPETDHDSENKNRIFFPGDNFELGQAFTSSQFTKCLYAQSVLDTPVSSRTYCQLTIVKYFYAECGSLAILLSRSSGHRVNICMTRPIRRLLIQLCQVEFVTSEATSYRHSKKRTH